LENEEGKKERPLWELTNGSETHTNANYEESTLWTNAVKGGSKVTEEVEKNQKTHCWGKLPN